MHKTENVSHDPVTGGMGRAEFFQKAKELLHKHYDAYAVISIDVREFKLINVSFGREIGNHLLSHIYGCIREELKESELIVRDSGDVFYLLMHERERQVILQRLESMRCKIDCLQRSCPCALKDSPYVALRFGIYLPEHEGENIDEMLEYANMARKHTTKVVPCGKECFYDPQRAVKVLYEKQKIGELQEAFDKEEFEVYLQPKVRVQDEVVAGAEALVRWRHPKEGLILPGGFIPILEKYNLIHRLDLFVFEQICKIVSGWTAEQQKSCPVSVNLSRLTLKIPELITILKGIADRYAVDCGLLELEITETSLIEDYAELQTFLTSVRDAGFRCSIDDFGFGYSSLFCLKELTVDAVKLDRGFFNGDSSKAKLIVKSMSNLATQLGYQTVAEGVETNEQLHFLKTTTCDLVQGYVFYRPMAVSKFEEVVFEGSEATSN